MHIYLLGMIDSRYLQFKMSKMKFVNEMIQLIKFDHH